MIDPTVTLRVVETGIYAKTWSGMKPSGFWSWIFGVNLADSSLDNLTASQTETGTCT